MQCILLTILHLLLFHFHLFNITRIQFYEFFHTSYSIFNQSHHHIELMLAREKETKNRPDTFVFWVAQEDCSETLKIDPINRPVD